MKVSCIILCFLAVLMAVSATQHACWKRSSTRGVGTIPEGCQHGWERNGALCYPLCEKGYHGVGPVCWDECPAGYHDDGALCRIPLKVVSADVSKCPWYDKCGLDHSCSKCPEGYHNDGCTCRIPLKVIAKKSYGRGVGKLMSCEGSKVESGGLCYPACHNHFEGLGPVCWQQCPTKYHEKCGWLCGEKGFSCSSEVKTFIKSSLTKIAGCLHGPTLDCIAGIAKEAKFFTLDGLCPI